MSRIKAALLTNSFPSLRTIKLGVKTQMASPKTGFSIKI